MMKSILLGGALLLGSLSLGVAGRPDHALADLFELKAERARVGDVIVYSVRAREEGKSYLLDHPAVREERTSGYQILARGTRGYLRMVSPYKGEDELVFGARAKLPTLELTAMKPGWLQVWEVLGQQKKHFDAVEDAWSAEVLNFVPAGEMIEPSVQLSRHSYSMARVYRLRTRAAKESGDFDATYELLSRERKFSRIGRTASEEPVAFSMDVLCNSSFLESWCDVAAAFEMTPERVELMKKLLPEGNAMRIRGHEVVKVQRALHALSVAERMPMFYSLDDEFGQKRRKALVTTMKEATESMLYRGDEELSELPVMDYGTDRLKSIDADSSDEEIKTNASHIYRFVGRRALAADQVNLGSRVFLAMQEYKRDHKAVPESLVALVPKYLSELPVDLFGEKLHYQVTKKGAKFWSKGPDRDDDGGKAGDIVWRVDLL